MAVRANIDIRSYALSRGVTIGAISEFLGYSFANNFSRRLGKELSLEEKERCRKAIDEISSKGAG